MNGLLRILLCGASILAHCRVFGDDASAAVQDFSSPVPYRTFSTTLDEQLEQLKDNPLLHRFRESRKALAAVPHRPIYHFTSPECRLNDPNGLCHWQNRWHLFYQTYPPEDPRQHWGHAVSDDLIHWHDLPYAIYPHPERAVFSGAMFVEKDRVIAHYHGNGGLAGNAVGLTIAEWAGRITA
jgi:beta-fructofuranosidase